MRRRSNCAIHTQHALLVAWGEYAQQIGLTEALGQVPLAQKKRSHTPQTKVLELLVATLAGLSYLEDISRSAHPLDQDLAVAQAWGQDQWADYSGVSRTLASLTVKDVEQIVKQLRQISQKFLAEEIERIQCQEGRLIYDGDLTGLSVSKSSQTYPNVSYGHMDDEIRLGYQAAVVSLHSPTYGRLWLSAAHHSGNAVSSTQAEALVQAAEGQTGRKPRRRTELLAQRLQQMEQVGLVMHQRVKGHQDGLAQARLKQSKTRGEIVKVQNQIMVWEQDYQTRQKIERPTSQLARARKRLEVFQRRDQRLNQTIAKGEKLLTWSEGLWQEHQSAQLHLQERLALFQQENEANPAPILAVFRLDAGFGTWENIALLIEMGYELYTKAFNPLTIQALAAQLPDPAPWVRVGQDADMITWPAHSLKQFCYPLDIGLERFTDDKRVKFSALLHFGMDPVAAQPQVWFSTYNQRQTIEAGIKEGKQVFQLHHLKVRSEPAIWLQENFVIFAANFIRWANIWLMTQSTGSAKNRLNHTRLGTKYLVQVAAHTSADVIWNSYGCLLRFSELSLLAGKELFLPPRPNSLKTIPKNLSFFRDFQRFRLWLHKT
jgi:hypothetical protein